MAILKFVADPDPEAFPGGEVVLNQDGDEIAYLLSSMGEAELSGGFVTPQNLREIAERLERMVAKRDDSNG